jgi:hypothetical protein
MLQWWMQQIEGYDMDEAVNAVDEVYERANVVDEGDEAERSLQIRQFPDIILRPEGIYESREALFAAVNAWIKPRGYLFTTGKSRNILNNRNRVVVACDRNRRSPNPLAARKRKTSSRVTGCKFSVLAKESLDQITWNL